MSMDDVYGKPGYLIRRAQQIAVAIFMEECAASGLTPVQYASLVAVREHPGIDATRLSALIAFDRSTLGSVLARLEAKGLITRAPSLEDGRIKLLTLTPEGEEALMRIAPLVEAAQARMLAPLLPAERQQLMTLLDKVIEANNGAVRPPLRLVADG